MKKISFAIVALVAILGFSNCTKNNTTTVNNAITEIFDIKPANWTAQNGFYFFSTDLSSFNKDIHFDGAYWAYISFDNEATYTLLETTIGNYTYAANFDTNPSDQTKFGVTIIAYPANNTNSAPGTTARIKVVSIPSVLQNSSNVNMKDYNAVKAAFHLN